MSEAIIVAIIAGAFSLFSGIMSAQMAANKSAQKFETSMQVYQAVSNERIEELTREVRSHNNFAQRMPVVEAEREELKQRIGEYHTQ